MYGRGFMSLWEIYLLFWGLIAIFVAIYSFLGSRYLLMFFLVSFGVYLILSALQREYYNYFNPELAFVLLIIFQASILTYVCIFALIYTSELLFYFEIGFFLYCLADLYLVYKDQSRC